ncbi:hypothetical protein JL720_5484 [Aureococcus anophagefferens]|nr:hypothetical protein JL720_5484 [Aureococcus anophagefferens]
MHLQLPLVLLAARVAALHAPPSALTSPRCTARRASAQPVASKPSKDPSTAPPGAHRCRWCGGTFVSRNAVFRHLREAESCRASATAEDARAREAIFARARDFTTTLLVGYVDASGADAERLVAAATGASRTTRASSSKARGRSAALESELRAASRDVISITAPAPVASTADLNARLPPNVRVLDRADGERVHAEASATQRAYHYLVPLSWLGVERAGGLVGEEIGASRGKFGALGTAHVSRSDGGLPEDVRAALQGLKAALKEATRTKGAWHNFADPSLDGGLLSPFSAATRTRLHRCRAAELVEVDGATFARARVRRVVAVAVLAARGALPADAFEVLTRRDVVLPTPLPPDLAYFAGARYDFVEKRGAGDLFAGGGATDAWQRDLRSARARGASPATASAVVAAESDADFLDAADLSPAPAVYGDALAELRRASDSGRWPKTSLARSKLIKPGDDAASFTLSRGGGGSRADALFPALADAVFALEEAIAPGRPPSTRCAVNRRARRRVDSGEGHGQSTSLIVGLGDFSGGELAVERRVSDVRYAPLEFDGWRERHWTLPFKGERYSLVFFTPAAPRARRSADDAAAAVLAGRASFAYRPGSSDALAIVEVLGDGCYATPPPSLDFDFSPAGRTVLDGGAHVGAFSRYALDEGAKRVVAFEPEPSNAALFARTTPAELVEAALVDGASGRATLVLGRTSAASGTRGATRSTASRTTPTDGGRVDAVSFDEALDGVDFVKLDVEGAEMAILAADREWRGVERLVFEWSFTKNPALAPFLVAVRRLEAAGFAVAYDGMGTWDAGPTWPGRTDALVFCARDI